MTKTEINHKLKINRNEKTDKKWQMHIRKLLKLKWKLKIYK